MCACLCNILTIFRTKTELPKYYLLWFFGVSCFFDGNDDENDPIITI